MVNTLLYSLRGEVVVSSQQNTFMGNYFFALYCVWDDSLRVEETFSTTFFVILIF